MENITNSKVFKPNGNQQIYLQVFLKQTNETTREQLCTETGITTKTLWEWEKNNDFREWIKGEVDKAVNKYTPGIKLKIFEKALQPKATIQERELALKIANEYVPTERRIIDTQDYEGEINKIIKKAKDLIEISTSNNQELISENTEKT